MTNLITSLGHALWMAFAMFWEILWPLILGFGLSGVVQAVVSKSEMTKLLPDDSPKSLAIATGLGAASSSCSYAAVALARSIFRKGADFTAAMAFELASTNLVAELSVILIVLMGWQFALAEFVGGPLMVVIVAMLFRIFLSRKLVGEARQQADKGIKGAMEGHAEMDMSVEGGAVLWNGGISFAGVIAFIYADLIVLPIIDIYRKYYGWKVAALIVGVFYIAMVGAALIVEFLFQGLGLIPQHRAARIVETSITFNYTTVLNIIFLALAAFLVVRFFRTGGPKMMAHMDS